MCCQDLNDRLQLASQHLQTRHASFFFINWQFRIISFKKSSCSLRGPGWLYLVREKNVPVNLSNVLMPPQFCQTLMGRASLSWRYCNKSMKIDWCWWRLSERIKKKEEEKKRRKNGKKDSEKSMKSVLWCWQEPSQGHLDLHCPGDHRVHADQRCLLHHCQSTRSPQRCCCCCGKNGHCSALSYSTLHPKTMRSFGKLLRVWCEAGYQSNCP